MKVSSIASPGRVLFNIQRFYAGAGAADVEAMKRAREARPFLVCTIFKSKVQFLCFFHEVTVLKKVT